MRDATGITIVSFRCFSLTFLELPELLAPSSSWRSPSYGSLPSRLSPRFNEHINPAFSINHCIFTSSLTFLKTSYSMSGVNSRSPAPRRADEETPLLGRPGKPSDGSRVLDRLRKHHNANVSKHWADLVLLFCYVITGLLDSSAVSIWGSFVSMQTGVSSVFLRISQTDSPVTR